MTNSLLISESKIRNIINEELRRFIIEKQQENFVRNRISTIVSETLDEMLSKRRINEESSDIDMKRQDVLNTLKRGGGDMYKNSTLAYNLWHPKNKSEKDTCRSLFSKKVNGTPDDDGVVRQFDDKEITKLYDMLHTH